jgi:hypothetical protein
LRDTQDGVQVGASIQVPQKATLEGIMQRAPGAVLLYNPHLLVQVAAKVWARRRAAVAEGRDEVRVAQATS